jgi:hypothetical protein
VTSVPPPPKTSLGLAVVCMLGGASVYGLTNMPPSFPPWAHWVAGMLLTGLAGLWGVYRDRPGPPAAPKP